MASLDYVLDASVGLQLYIPNPLSNKATRLVGCLSDPANRLSVPDLFYVEVANALWKYARAGQLTQATVLANLADLKALPFSAHATSELIEPAARIGMAHGITAYDASYVALAWLRDAPLLTLDRKLVEALANSPYPVQLFSEFELPR